MAQGVPAVRGDVPPVISGEARAVWGSKLEFLLSAVGYAVGLGNVWRFPYLCYQNGGGAFLIPYVLMLAMVGLPLFYMELAFGQYASLGPITIWRVSPLFKGIGYSMVVLTLIVSIYYNVIMAFTIHYLFASFTSTLPWAACSATWTNCVDNRFNDTRNQSAFANPGDNSSAFTTPSMKGPAQVYWESDVLGMNNDTSIGNLGGIQWRLCLSLILAWIIVFLCIAKGIKSSGKVVYFTATFPYVMLFILFIRGVTLPGAGQGIVYYLRPDFHRMAHVTVWKDAAVQILYSLGPGFGTLLTMGSYNKFHNNCYKDAVIVSLINCGTSVFAGFVIFSVLGFMAHTHNVDVGRVVDSGESSASWLTLTRSTSGGSLIAVSRRPHGSHSQRRRREGR
ncbi:Sodium- and chloride-dependent glycine transporter 1 [Lamellibrachia satsuma]|nr:Sodium- and chloride-dependent glycine transporter 1 [Lamellibrachia satsuma]